MVTSYQLEWSYDKCSDDPVENRTAISTSSTMYNLTLSDLRPDTNYTISVSASNSVGESSREKVLVDTKEASKSYAIVQAPLTIINPCAARIMVLGLLVCLSVRLSTRVLAIQATRRRNSDTNGFIATLA